MPLDRVAVMDVDIVARAFLFYLLLMTLFINHGNDANLALLPSLQDLDVTRQFNLGAAALSYLYYGMDLCVREVHLKVDYRRAIEQQQRNKRVRGSSDSRAPNTTVVVGKLEHGPGASFSFILEHIGQPAQGMLETYLRASMAPPASRGWGTQHVSHAGCGAGRRLVIVEESEESSSEDSRGDQIQHVLGLPELSAFQFLFFLCLDPVWGTAFIKNDYSIYYMKDSGHFLYMSLSDIEVFVLHS
ncbi:hypothetical protein JCGZ_19558 [Jatropha curcas]|uniref:Uncharacterized protein n=1 Tax=Jatropha curcas TaxID=180498 RepID=A0A067JUM4_JATCU|nr:hypothetical protein JCGZ_19558 [Jatropha curcas]